MKAVVLFSGGLDSILATEAIKRQGIEVIALNFKSPFWIWGKRNQDTYENYYHRLSENLGIRIEIIDITEEFFEIVKNPKYGYGANMNPCVDCRILMLSKAKEFMQDKKAQFIVTGEVLGQRPMSQLKNTLIFIDRQSNLEGWVLRPLSARLLPLTIPEKNGWVKRDKLWEIAGRNRKTQMALAKDFGIKEYLPVAGGCLLTDAGFSRRIKDLLSYGTLNVNDVELLKIGRHFRISQEAKLIVGRNEKENDFLLGLLQKGDYLFMPFNTPGPISLGRGNFDASLVKLSCQISARYCDLNGSSTTLISYCKIPEEKTKSIEVIAIDDHKLRDLRI